MNPGFWTDENNDLWAWDLKGRLYKNGHKVAKNLAPLSVRKKMGQRQDKVLPIISAPTSKEPATHLAHDQYSKDQLQIQCAWCKRFQQLDGSYSDINPNLDLAISHGICPECAASWYQQEKRSAIPHKPLQAEFYCDECGNAQWKDIESYVKDGGKWNIKPHPNCHNKPMVVRSWESRTSKTADYFYDWQGYYPDDGSLEDSIVSPAAPAPSFINTPDRCHCKQPGHLVNTEEFDKENPQTCPDCGKPMYPIKDVGVPNALEYDDLLWHSPWWTMSKVAMQGYWYGHENEGTFYELRIEGNDAGHALLRFSYLESDGMDEEDFQIMSGEFEDGIFVGWGQWISGYDKGASEQVQIWHSDTRTIIKIGHSPFIVNRQEFESSLSRLSSIKESVSWPEIPEWEGPEPTEPPSIVWDTCPYCGSDDVSRSVFPTDKNAPFSGGKLYLCNTCGQYYDKDKDTGTFTFPEHWAKFADYNGWTNWDTWHTVLLIDNEQWSQRESIALVQNGGTINDLADWAIQKILAPYNQSRFEEANGWNSKSTEERYQIGLEQGKQDWEMYDFVQNYTPNEMMLMEEHQINWQEIYDHIKDDIENYRNSAYEDLIDSTDRMIQWGQEDTQRRLEEQQSNPYQFRMPQKAIQEALYRHMCPMCRGYLDRQGEYYKCRNCPWSYGPEDRLSKLAEYEEENGEEYQEQDPMEWLPLARDLREWFLSNGVGGGYKDDLAQHIAIELMMKGMLNSDEALWVAEEVTNEIQEKILNTDKSVGKDWPELSPTRSYPGDLTMNDVRYPLEMPRNQGKVGFENPSADRYKYDTPMPFRDRLVPENLHDMNFLDAGPAGIIDVERTYPRDENPFMEDDFLPYHDKPLRVSSESIFIPEDAREELNNFWNSHSDLRKECEDKYGFDPIDEEANYWKHGLADEPDHSNLLKEIKNENNMFSLELVKRWEQEELAHV